MNKLNERRRLDMRGRGLAARSASEGNQQGSQALTATRDDMFCHLIHEGDRALQARPDHRVDGVEVALHQGADLIERHDLIEDHKEEVYLYFGVRRGWFDPSPGAQ